MDYKQACARLDGPRKQDQKNLGHKLLLHYDVYSEPTAAGDTGDPVATEAKAVHLRYFDTTILSWYPDGTVRIGAAGYWDSNFTRDKINEYAPRGWRMDKHNLRYNRGKVCATITVRTDTWEWVRSMPYEDNMRYGPEGRVSHVGTPFASMDASRALDDVADTVKETVAAFLCGELARPETMKDFKQLDILTMASIETYTKERQQLLVDVATSRTASRSLIWGVIDERYENSFRLKQLGLYSPENYPFTGKPRTQKARVAQMEHFLRVGNDHMRYAKNSEEFHAMKNDLMAECELWLLRELGFEVKEYERRPRTPW